MNPEMVNDAQNIMLVVQGGIGRNICASAVVRAIKKAHPLKPLAVLCGCPEVFNKNPNVKKIVNLSHPGSVYDPFVKDSKTIILTAEPYQNYDYIYRRKHFVECWCDEIGVPADGIYPEMYFSIAEMEMGLDWLHRFSGKMVLFQHQGGKIPTTNAAKDKMIAKNGMFRRNLPETVAQEVTDGLIERGYYVGSVGHENQFLPKQAEAIKFPPRAVTALIPNVRAVITIDSYLLHAAACFKDKTPTLALWGGTNPKVLGYPTHRNMTRSACDTPMCHRPDSFLFDNDTSGYTWDCPHNDICCNYTSEEILNAFDEMIKENPNDGDNSESRFKETQIKNLPCGKTGVPCGHEGHPVEEIPAGVGPA